MGQSSVVTTRKASMSLRGTERKIPEGRSCYINPSPPSHLHPPQVPCPARRISQGQPSTGKPKGSSPPGETQHQSPGLLLGSARRRTAAPRRSQLLSSPSLKTDGQEDISIRAMPPPRTRLFIYSCCLLCFLKCP